MVTLWEVGWEITCVLFSDFICIHFTLPLSLLKYTQDSEINVNFRVLHSLSDRQCHQVCECPAPKWPPSTPPPILSHLPGIDFSLFDILITSSAPQHFRPDDTGGSILSKAYGFALRSLGNIRKWKAKTNFHRFLIPPTHGHAIDLAVNRNNKEAARQTTWLLVFRPR